MSALSVLNLCKQYPSFRLNNVSFTVGEGRVVGLIGANGAGKSTAMKGILNFIRTDGGSVSLFGQDMRACERACKEQIGYVAGGFPYYPQKKIRLIGKTVASFYGNWNASAFSGYLRAFHLDENKKPCELSDGMKVKLFIALALSHGARLLIMDEPTSGLDPLSREEFCDIILEIVKKEGVSVLFSTHVTSDLMRIADDIVYISQGEVLAEGELASVLNGYEIASFSQKPAGNSGAIGVKEIKNGYEGLIPAGAPIECESRRPADLDGLMIHLEYAKKEQKPCRPF